MIRNLVIFMLFTIPILSGTASADEGYFGVKFGPMLVDLGGGVDDPLNAGFIFGSSKSGGAVEGEITTSMVKGGTDNVDLTISTFGIYGVYRSEGEGAFFKIKGGFVKEDVKIESCCGSVSGDDNGSSFGIGFGSRSSDNMFEVEYTVIEEDVNFLSFGVLF